MKKTILASFVACSLAFTAAPSAYAVENTSTYSSQYDVSKLKQQIAEFESRLLKLKQDVEMITMGVMADIEKQRSHFESMISSYKAKLRDAEKRHEMLHFKYMKASGDEKETLKSHLKEVSQEIESLRSKIETLNMERDSRIADLEGYLKHEMQSLETRMGEIKEKLSTLRHRLSTLMQSGDIPQESIPEKVNGSDDVAKKSDKPQNRLEADKARLAATKKQLSVVESRHKEFVAKMHNQRSKVSQRYKEKTSNLHERISMLQAEHRVAMASKSYNRVEVLNESIAKLEQRIAKYKQIHHKQSTQLERQAEKEHSNYYETKKRLEARIRNLETKLD